MRIYTLNRLENVRDNVNAIIKRLHHIKPKKKTGKKNTFGKKNKVAELESTMAQGAECHIIKEQTFKSTPEDENEDMTEEDPNSKTVASKMTDFIPDETEAAPTVNIVIPPPDNDEI